MRGFPNYGNTCYANSILQILIHTKELQDILDKYPPRDELTDIWHNIMTRYTSPDEPIILRRFLKLFIQQHHDVFGIQQDQAEFLGKILRYLHEWSHVPARFRIMGQAGNDIDKLELQA